MKELPDQEKLERCDSTAVITGGTNRERALLCIVFIEDTTVDLIYHQAAWERWIELKRN